MTTQLKIDGMTCQNCVRHATEALLAVPGVTAAEVTLDPGAALVTHEDVQTQALIEALAEEDYIATEN